MEKYHWFKWNQKKCWTAILKLQSIGEKLGTVNRNGGGCPRWLIGKESAANGRDTGDVGSIPGSGRSPREGNGNPL